MVLNSHIQFHSLMVRRQHLNANDFLECFKTMVNKYIYIFNINWSHIIFLQRNPPFDMSDASIIDTFFGLNVHQAKITFGQSSVSSGCRL